ncbi:hypothetical protein KAX08_02980 [candidate division WOR-3 bacterium]|nr:hypothetical protein [candidate division WOR-3 bacterium]
MNKEIIKHWVQNRWVIRIGSGLITYLIISIITSSLQNINLISAFRKVLFVIVNFIKFRVPIWTVIIGLVVLFLIYVFLNQIKKQHILQKITSKSTKKSRKLLFNIDKIASSLVEVNLDEVQEVLSNCIVEIMYSSEQQFKSNMRGFLVGDITVKKILDWLDSLENSLKNYKWSRIIPFEKLLSRLNLRYYTNRDRDIPYKTILTLYGLYNSIPKEEREAFANSVLLQLKPIIKEEEKEAPPNEDEELPF